MIIRRFVFILCLGMAFAMFTSSQADAQSCANPPGNVADIFYSSSFDVFQGCTQGMGWVALHGKTGYTTSPPSPTNCPSIGDTCDDGSYYIGDIGAGAVYATNESFESLQTWNDGNTNYSNISGTNLTDGESNTATLVTADSDDVTGGVQPHDAAIYCDGLNAHGRSDWYLPALYELDLFWNNGAPVANIDESGSSPDGVYWASSQKFSGLAHIKAFSINYQGDLSKDSEIAVRCVRNEPPAPGSDCANPAGNFGDIFYNNIFDAIQGCTQGAGWVAFHNKTPDPCTGTSTSPTIGETCTDGSIYAGDSPDGNVPMYTTQNNEPGTYSWNDGTLSPTPDTAMENCTDGPPGTATTCQTGEANTAFLVGATGEPDYPYFAAESCDELLDHGHDDWYLPARDELNVLYTNKNEGDLNGTFPTFRNYWSSSELNDDFSRHIDFDDGSEPIADKRLEFTVRCVRR
ncbi:Lcl domain-containing protein [Roseovarius ramblicola]|uniref:DUF1566 domain-containing protein n=1 Tax=Roseovarius ramblicola TaxID=2022336 RepID=A0ABV5I4M0_9RHOB